MNQFANKEMLSAFLLRLVCSNGAVHHVNIGDGQNKYYHHGLNPDTINWYLAEFLKLLGPYFAELEEKMHRLASTPFHPDDQFINENIKSGMPAFAWNNLIKGFRKEHEKEATLYDFYNNITSHAKGLEPGLRLMYERIAGKISEI